MDAFFILEELYKETKENRQSLLASLMPEILRKCANGTDVSVCLYILRHMLQRAKSEETQGCLSYLTQEIWDKCDEGSDILLLLNYLRKYSPDERDRLVRALTPELMGGCPPPNFLSFSA